MGQRRMDGQMDRAKRIMWPIGWPHNISHKTTDLANKKYTNDKLN